MRNPLTFVATFTIGVVLAASVRVDLHGQALRRAELQRTETAIRRLMESRSIRDRRVIEALRDAFNGPPKADPRVPWRREPAIARVEAAMAARFDPPIRNKRIASEQPPRQSGTVGSFLLESPAVRMTASDFVDFVAARIRLDTVLEEILGTRKVDAVLRLREAPGDAPVRQLAASQPLTRESLKTQLQSIGVVDAADVSASFDWRQPASTHVITLPAATGLWRLSGGASAAVGRYFVCCDWRLDLSGASGRILDLRWFDATGLALPPGNRAQDLIAATLPAGTRVVVGVVADNFAKTLGKPVRGGGTQIFVPQPVTGMRLEEFSLRAEAPSADADAPLSVHANEVAVWHEDRLLRFRPEKR
jgi:hypothetical protein